MDLTLVYVRSGELKILDKAQECIINSGEYAFIRQNPNLKAVKTEPYKDISLTLEPDTLKEIYNKVHSLYISMNTIIPKDSAFKLRPNADLKSLFLSLAIYSDNNVLPTTEILRLKSLEGIYALLNNSEVFFPVLFGDEMVNQ